MAKDLSDMTDNQKEAFTRIGESLNRKKSDSEKRIDHAKFLWSLNSPKCLCDPCYVSWLETGSELYKDQPEVYEKRVGEEETHREARKAGREYNLKNPQPMPVFV